MGDTGMTFSDMVRTQYTTLPIVPTPQDCNGKTYIVTGANTGLGFECAKHLVRLSAAKVILGVRSLSKGETARSKIEAATGRKGVAEVWHLDLTSYESVQNFAKKVRGLDRVDAVIENASVALDKWTYAEGLETTLTVNVVSTFLLAALILQKLQESSKKFGNKPYLVVVGSGAGFSQKGVLEKIDGDIFDGLNQGGPTGSDMDGGARYPVSKLLQYYIVRQLAMLKRVSETGIIINILSPGLCTTELSRHVRFTIWLRIAIMRLLLARTAEAGSRTLLQAVVAGEESHGKWLDSCEIKEHYVPEWAKDDAGRKMQDRVWESLSRKLNAIQPGCV